MTLNDKKAQRILDSEILIRQMRENIAQGAYTIAVVLNEIDDLSIRERMRVALS